MGCDIFTFYFSALLGASCLHCNFARYFGQSCIMTITRHFIERAGAVLALYACLSIAAASIAYVNTLRIALDDVQANGTVRLTEAASRLRLQIDGFRALVNIIANEPQVLSALAQSRFDPIQPDLQNFEATYGAWRIDVADPSGMTKVSSNKDAVGQRHVTPLMRAAMNNRLGFAQAIEGEQRLIRLSRGVKGDTPKPMGVVVVNVALADLEFEWPVSPEPILFFDAERLSLSSNRLDLLLLSHGNDPEEAPLNLHKTGTIVGFDLWRFHPPEGAPQEVITNELFVPHLDLTAMILLDTAQARSTARLRAILVLAGALVIGLIGAIVWQQHRRLLVEARHSAELETRVEARTSELRQAQEDLVEASKLAALGRLSAGISHELNQPLAAILNFAENGRKFLDRSKPDAAGENLALISGQINRITRIIGNLRAFARQEVEPTDTIDFVEITRAALQLCQDDVSAAGVTLDVTLPGQPVLVLAGRVRLEQVVLNLITNAVDAMSETAQKRLDVRLTTGAVLTVRDSGHGIKDVGRVFEPFYTTKELGSSKGLGMGLALSHGIIARFGGTLTCRNLTPGAEFKITLPLEDQADA